MMSNDFLSQEELDALLKQIETLTDVEKDMIGEIGNIILGAGATALSNILGRKVDISTPSVEVKPITELRNELSGEKVCVVINFEGAVSGINALVLEKLVAAEIADIMMGGMGTVQSEELDELKLSALGEAMNQMMGSAATSLSDMIKRPVNITPPQVEVLDFSKPDVQFPPVGALDEEVAKVNFTMEIEGLEPAKFFLAMPIPFVKKLYDMIFTPVKEEKSASASSSTPKPTQPSSVAAVPKKEEKSAVTARPVQFEDFGKSQPTPATQELVIDERLQLLFDVPLNVTVELGRTKLTLKEVMELGVGSLIELDKLTGEPVDIYVNNKLIARGEVVVIDENFGVRITEIVSPKERFYSLK